MDQALHEDFDNFLRFCEEHHMEESLMFWADAETFRIRALEQEFSSPPTPKTSTTSSSSSSSSAMTTNTTTSPSNSSLSSATVLRVQSSPSSDSSSSSFPRRQAALLLSRKRSGSGSGLFLRIASNIYKSKSANNNGAPSSSLQEMGTNTHHSEEEEKQEVLSPAFRSTRLQANVFSGSGLLMEGGSKMKRGADDAPGGKDIKEAKAAIATLLDMARAIVYKYLDVNSPSSICLSDELIDVIEDELETGSVSSQLFAEAQRIVYTEMKLNIYPLYRQKHQSSPASTRSAKSVGT